MKLEDMLKQQEKRGFKQNKLKAKMQTYDEYVSDVASPRPYNTPNVVDKVIHLETRDIDETAPLDFTRDTIPVGSDELIRDTKSDTTPISIRDTIKGDLTERVRDTIPVGSDELIRDTKSDTTPISIRDTTKGDLTERVSDTIPAGSDEMIRDTKSDTTSISIRDTIKGDLTERVRDTIPAGSDELIRDTKSDTTPISIRDTILIDNYNEKVETSENGLIDTFKERNDLYHQHKNLNQNLIRTINKKSTRFRYLDLTGNEKRIVDEIINNCIIVGELTTPFIKKIDLSINTGVKVGALKTTICRLKDKNVITAYIATKGRNSSWKISLSAEILEQYIQLRKR